jgi:hypothetical protein
MLAASCGGGGSGSPTSSSYPAVQGTYGSYVGIPAGTSQLRWTAPDGSATMESCLAITRIPTQNGAQFSGSVERLAPCSSQATFTGTVSVGGSIALTLTQTRWGSCTMTGGGQYTGVVSLGSLLASGRVTVQCDDGRVMTIDEQLSGSLSVPPRTG